MVGAALLGLLVVLGGAILIAAGVVVYLLTHNRGNRVAQYLAFGLIGLGFLTLISAAVGLLALALWQ